MSLVRLARLLRKHRYLLVQMTRRMFFARHAGRALGWGWSLLSMLVQFAILWFVFGKVLRVRLGGAATQSFSLYLLAGLVPFLALSDAVLRGAGVLRRNAALVCRVRFPVEVLVIGDVLASAAHRALGLLLVVVLCAVRGGIEPVRIGWFLAGMLVVLLWMAGLALLASAAGAFLPDLEEGLELAMQVVFYGAPVVYPLSLVPEGWMRSLVEANPVTLVASSFRAFLLGMEPPSPAAFGVLVAGGLVLVTAGARVVDRYRLRFADVL